MINKCFVYVSLYFLLSTMAIHAQKVDTKQTKILTERTQPAPESVFKKFREAGMKPVNHILTEAEEKMVSKAFSVLPPLHQKILKEHLHSISFMDNMPNTALTSVIETSGSAKMYNITFRAEILNETISEWATWKENICYTKSGNSEYEVIIDAGYLDAIMYVLLHEATHVVDGVVNITPHPDDMEMLVTTTPFTAGVWSKQSEPLANATSTLLETTRFRGGMPIPISSAPDVYKALEKTPFVSLYSMASWHEDLAELLTIYHLAVKMNQPYKIKVMKNGIAVFTYEPFSNNRFYKDEISWLCFMNDIIKNLRNFF